MRYLFLLLIFFTTGANGQYPNSAQYVWNLGLVKDSVSRSEAYHYFVMEINSNATFELRSCFMLKGSTLVFPTPLAAGNVREKGDTLLLSDTLGIKPGTFQQVLQEKKFLFVPEKEGGRLITADPVLAGNHFYQTMYFYPEGQKWKYGGRDPEGRKHLTWTIYARDGTPLRWMVYDHGVVVSEK